MCLLPFGVHPGKPMHESHLFFCAHTTQAAWTSQPQSQLTASPEAARVVQLEQQLSAAVARAEEAAQAEAQLEVAAADASR